MADGVRSLAAADVDLDGDVDLVAAAETIDTIVWYENTAGGTFWPAEVISNTSAGATAVMVVDIDRDGLPDILSASHDDDTIAWHAQSSGPLPPFTERVITEDPDGIGGAEGFVDGPRSVFAADLDQDGDPDVLSASENDGHVAWFENVAGDGSIWNPRSIDTTLGGARSVTAADVDGDGDLDVLAAGADDDTIAWYENLKGDGTVWVARTISTSSDGASFVAAADVDLDGDTDVLASSALDDTIAWHENTSGDGTSWSPHVIDSAADGAAQASPVDLDRDGDIDVLAVRPGEDTVTWYENESGDGSVWTERVLSAAIAGAGAAIAFDPDTDGDLDVVSASPINGEILQHENVVIGRTAAFFDPSPAGSANEQILLDQVDGDGILDLIAVHRRYSLDDQLMWHSGLRDGGGFGPPRYIDLVDSFYAIATADVDLDGDVDVIAETPGSTYWYENASGDGITWTRRTVGSHSQFGLAIATADVDGDGDQDVLATQIESIRRVVWYENRINDPFPLEEWPANPLATVPSNPASVGSGDLDGDGDRDIVVAVKSDTNNFAYWHENLDGAGAFGPVRMISTEISGEYGSHLTVVDLDLDGDNDIVAVGSRYPATDRAFMWFENTTGDATSWTTRLPPSSGGFSKDAFPADMDLDGDLDIVTAMSYRNITWWENSGGDATSWTEHETLTDLDDSAKFLAIGDLDLDGDPDVVANRGSGPFWHENVGGQYSLPTSDIVTYPVLPTPAVLEIAAVHEGRPGDPDIELQTIELLFESEPGEPLSSGEANNVVEHLRIYLDDGSGEFEVETDALVIEIGDLVLVSGIQTVSFVTGDPLVLLTPGTTRTYFVVLEQAGTFLEPPVRSLRVTHNTETGGTAEDIGANVPVTATRAPNVTTGTLLFNTPEVTRVSPRNDDLEVGVGSNVSLIFSTALDPSTVSSSTIRLLDPHGMVVPAEVSAGPAELVRQYPRAWDAYVWGYMDRLFPIAVPETFNVADVGLSYQMKNLDIEPMLIELIDPAGEVTVQLWPQCSTPDPLEDINVVFDDDGTSPVCESPLQGIIAPPPDMDPGLGSFWDRNANGDWDVHIRLWGGGPSTQATLLHLAIIFERWHVTVNPLQPLDPDTVYTLEVTNGVRSASGNNAAPFTAAFHTESTPGSTSDASSVSELAEGSANWELGSSVASIGDFNGDGLDDYAVGAPGYSLDAKPEVGAALLFLGREDAAPPDPADLYRTQPDVIFVGESAHDRVGVSLARTTDLFGTYGFDPAILIGAEQVNRTDEDDPIAGCDAGAPCGPGRVFMVRFESSTYPNLDDPSVTDIVTLEPGYPIITYVGEALGDRAGYAVAGDGRTGKGPLRAVLIGAPGRDTAQGVDSGAAYLIHEWASVYTPGNRDMAGSGWVYTLDKVANGLSDEIPGMIIEGEAAGDQFGSSVAFRGDLSTTVNDDVIVGAPFSDAVAPDGGAAYFVRGGELPTAVVTAADIGSSLPGTRVLGDSPGAQLGHAVADGGNYLTDGGRDLLLGAPGYDDGASVDAGLVAHVGTDLPEGTVQLSSIGYTLPGLLWIGSQAGERLGSAVAGVGDVTGDGLDDILLAAPNADGSGNSSAGRIYLIEGSIRDDLLLGSLDVGRIGHDLGGRRYDGLVAGELAGFSVSGGGDFDADGRKDWIAGAPAYGLGDEGRVFFVTETRTPPCGPDGCVVAHLATGARLELFAGSLAVATDVGIVGLVHADDLPGPPLAGTVLVGAAVLSPDGLAPTAPAVDLHIPTPQTMTEQLVPAETLDVWRYDGATWVNTGVDGVVVANPYHAGRLAIEADVDTLLTYSVFVPDADQDDYRDSVDCDSADGQIWTTPGETRDVRLDHDSLTDSTTIAWSTPDQPGATSVRYDTLRSTDAVDFVSKTICLESDDGTDTSATDDSLLLPGQLIFYLVRAENDCPSGSGSLGQDSDGVPRNGIDCP